MYSVDNRNNLIENPYHHFIEEIIDGMYDWVRVLDRSDNIIYVNKAMAEGLKGFPIGKKCYEAIGLTAPCDNCTSRKSVFDGRPHEKEEIINGMIFSVMSSPVRNENGEIIAVVEVLRNITHLKHLQAEILEQNKKLQEDLNIAKKLQCRLLPKQSPENRLNFSYIYQPCEKLGGDFIDLFKIDENHTGIYIADVSGHGVSASMLTVFLRSSINKKTLSPAQALGELYRDFNNNSFDPDLYITIFYAIVDLKEKTLAYANAGLNVCPILFNQSRFELLRSPGIPISNWVEQPDYADRKVSLQKADRIFLYTDGIIEIKNSMDEQFGEDRLLELLLSNVSLPSGILNGIIESARSFAGAHDFSQISDDITMALLEME